MENYLERQSPLPHPAERLAKTGLRPEPALALLLDPNNPIFANNRLDHYHQSFYDSYDGIEPTDIDVIDSHRYVYLIVRSVADLDIPMPLLISGLSKSRPSSTTASSSELSLDSPGPDPSLMLSLFPTVLSEVLVAYDFDCNFLAFISHSNNRSRGINIPLIDVNHALLPCPQTPEKSEAEREVNTQLPRGRPCIHFEPREWGRHVYHYVDGGVSSPSTAIFGFRKFIPGRLPGKLFLKAPLIPSPKPCSVTIIQQSYLAEESEYCNALETLIRACLGGDPSILPDRLRKQMTSLGFFQAQEQAIGVQCILIRSMPKSTDNIDSTCLIFVSHANSKGRFWSKTPNPTGLPRETDLDLLEIRQMLSRSSYPNGPLETVIFCCCDLAPFIADQLRAEFPMINFVGYNEELKSDDSHPFAIMTTYLACKSGQLSVVKKINQLSDDLLFQKQVKSFENPPSGLRFEFGAWQVDTVIESCYHAVLAAFNSHSRLKNVFTLQVDEVETRGRNIDIVFQLPNEDVYQLIRMGLDFIR